MAFYTASDLRQRAGGITASAAGSELSHMAKSAAGIYDVFLSHSLRDAVLVVGLKNELEGQGLSVYVDWLEDPHLDRSDVTPLTAQKLRERMTACRTLVYATSRSASTSRWMPWELGYFDGHHGESRIAICPIQEGTESYVGQEYVGLYKQIEKIRHNGTPRPFAVKPSRLEGELMRSFVEGRGNFMKIKRS